MYLHARRVPYIAVYVCMHLLIKLEIQSSQDVHRTPERALFLCKVVIPSMAVKQEFAVPVHLTLFLSTVRGSETLAQIPSDINFSNNMLDDGQQPY